MPPNTFVVLNAASARFECTFGRGCEGVCCRNGRPSVSQAEARRIDASFPEVLGLLRTEARKMVEQVGYLSRRRKHGEPMLRVVHGWCVFYHQGCTLQRVGQALGNKFAFKPLACALFPLNRRGRGSWYVRQKGYEGELWDLCCLAPAPDTPLAAKTLREEFALAARLR